MEPCRLGELVFMSPWMHSPPSYRPRIPANEDVPDKCKKCEQNRAGRDGDEQKAPKHIVHDYEERINSRWWMKSPRKLHRRYRQADG
jgi:hypothetical protein